MIENNTISFSIIIPVYNVQDYLRKCLESVLFQEYTNFEVICINDASADDSLSILQEYAKLHSNIIIINKTNNEGVSSARNKGIELAKGDYILFVDSDDFYYHRQVLSELNKVITYSNADVVYFPGGCIIPGWEGSETYKDREYKSGWECLSEHCNKSKIIVFGSVYTQCYKRKIIIENELRFDTSFMPSEDRLFVVQFFYYAKKTVVYPHPFYCYNVRPNSLMTSADKKAIRIDSGIKCAFLIWHFCKSKNIIDTKAIYTYVNGLYISSVVNAYKLNGKTNIDKTLLLSTSIGFNRFSKSVLLSIHPSLYISYKDFAVKILRLYKQK